MDIQKNQTQESFEKLYVKNAPAWSLERDQNGGYKYHATQSAFLLFEQQQIEIDLLKNELAKAQVPEGFVLVPIKPTETMVMAVVKEHEGDAFLPYSLYDAYRKQAMIEAQGQSNE